MKRRIVASENKTRAVRCARRIESKMQELLDAMEDTPSGFLEANDLGDLYELLIDDIPMIDRAIEDDSIEYKNDKYGVISKDGFRE